MRVILVPVADRPECGRALKTAFDLGERLGASVNGCHMRPHRYSDKTLSAEVAEAAWLKKASKRSSEAAESLYRSVAGDHGYDVVKKPRPTPCARWAEMVGSPDKLMGIVGPVSDLIVVSRPANAGGVADLFLRSALFETSRPVLLLPQAGRAKVATKIVIAWNQSVDAARAVSAAIPLMQQADSVTIVTAGAEDRAGPKASHLAAYLAHWGIKTGHVEKRGRKVNEELLDAARETDADLLVAGAYSKSRWRERVFGGTTEFLIRKARLPVLLLHV